MSDIDQLLNRLRESHRATARYGICRHRLAADGYSRIQDVLPYTGLPFEEADRVRIQLDKQARDAAGNPVDTWGLTMHVLKLETPLPKRRQPDANHFE